MIQQYFSVWKFQLFGSRSIGQIITDFIHIYQTLRSGRIWHKVNF